MCIRDRVVSTLGEVGRKADSVLVAVPVARTPEVLEELAGELGEGKILMDIASVKEGVVSTMRRVGGRLEMVSLHPLFGPGARTLRGKIVISVPVRGGRRYMEFRRCLISGGARVVEMGATEHDKLMAVVQAATHFLLLLHLATLEKSGREWGEISTPIFTSLLELGKAVLATNPEVYGEIQLFNRYSRRVRELLVKEGEKFARELSSGKVDRISRVFEKGLRIWGEGEIQKAYEKLYERFERLNT